MVTVGIAVVAGALVIIEPWLAVPVAIGGGAAFIYGLWPGQFRRAFSRVPSRGQHRGQWIPLDEALRWVADNSGWGEEKFPDSHILPAAVDLRQSARSGHISIEGRKEIGRHFPGDRFSMIWEPINPEFWSTHQFDLTVALDDTAGSNEPQTEVEAPGDLQTESVPSYTALRVEWEALHKLWPPRKR